MANAIVGSAEIVLLATLMGLPVGFMAGVYLSEFGGKTFAFMVRYMADLLNGVPSIVIGIFVWTVVVTRYHFSAYRRSHRSGLDPDSNYRPQHRAVHETVFRKPCAKARWRLVQANGRPSPRWWSLQLIAESPQA